MTLVGCAPPDLAFAGPSADTSFVGGSPDSLARNRRLMAYTAAAMYGAAALDELITGFLPGDPPLSPLPVVTAVFVVAALVLAGPRLPAWALAALGPLGVALIAQALAGAPQAGDAAVLYIWPVLWSSFFFGRRGATAILLCVAVAQALVLLSLPGRDGYPGRWLEVMISAGAVAVVVVMLRERSERLLERLAVEARVDALTGLLNRRGFEERAALELARARRDGAATALATFDVDRFKQINDRCGHEVGDRVLARTGGMLAALTREIDVLARLGGDEFTVLLPGCAAAEAELLAERVRAALGADGASGLPQPSVSVGIAAGSGAVGVEAMLRSADAALYEVKRAGGDGVVVADPPPGAACAPRPLSAAAARR